MLKKIEAIDRPWYLLQYAFKANAHAQLVKDKKEEEDIFNLKKSWYDADPERYQRSMDLRENYLAKYRDPGCECPEEYNFDLRSLNNSQTAISEITRRTLDMSIYPIEEDDESAIRMNKSPKWSNIIIPPFDLSPFYRPQCPCPLEFKSKQVKTEEDHIQDRNEREQMIEEYNASIEKRRRDMELWLDESKERRTIVFSWYLDCRKASEKIMREYYQTRQSFIEQCQQQRQKSSTKANKKGNQKNVKGK